MSNSPTNIHEFVLAQRILLDNVFSNLSNSMFEAYKHIGDLTNEISELKKINALKDNELAELKERLYGKASQKEQVD